MKKGFIISGPGYSGNDLNNAERGLIVSEEQLHINTENAYKV